VRTDSIWSVAWAGDSLVTGGVDGFVKSWSPSQQPVKNRHSWSAHPLGVISVACNGIGSIAASSGLDSRIKLWDLQKGQAISDFQAGDMSGGPIDTWAIAFSPSGGHLASSNQAGNVALWDLNLNAESQPTANLVSTLKTNGKFAMSVAYSQSGQYVACGAIDGVVTIFDVASSKRLHTIEGHNMAVRSLAFSADSRMLLTASDDMQIHLYDVDKPSELVASFSGHSSWVLAVAFAPDGRTFATGSSDRTVKLWDISGRATLHTFSDHSDPVWGVAYNPVGSHLVSVGDDASMVIYTLNK